MRTAADPQSSNRRLGSWKEVAAFFESDESTVRRWEKERGLPIHRVPGGAGAKIFAYTEELDAWLAGSKAGIVTGGNGSGVPESPAAEAPAPQAKPAIRRRTEIGLMGLVILGVLAAVRFFPGPKELPQRAAIRSIAVLPLANFTGDSSQEYLAGGMTDELITELARISSLRVVSRTSVQQYAKTSKPLPLIAQELDVDAVVEGSVGRGRSGIRVNVQLLDARHDRHIWADTLERGMEDASSMQHELAEEIAHQIGVQLTPLEKQYFAGRHPVAPESFQDYLQGRYYWNKRTPDGLDKAEGYFREAIARDPKNPLAFAGLADTYLLESLYSRAATDETLRKAGDAASRAIALDDQRAEELDPFSMIIHHEAGQILQNARQYAQALEEYARAESIAPDFPQPHDSAALAHRRLGEIDLALKELRSAALLSPNFLGPGAVDAIASAYAKSGRRGFLLQSLALLRFYPHPAYSAALDYADLGDATRAFGSLEEAYREHNLDVLSLKCSPELDGLRGDSRYADLLKRIGLDSRN